MHGTPGAGWKSVIDGVGLPSRVDAMLVMKCYCRTTAAASLLAGLRCRFERRHHPWELQEMIGDIREACIGFSMTPFTTAQRDALQKRGAYSAPADCTLLCPGPYPRRSLGGQGQTISSSLCPRKGINATITLHVERLR